MWLFWVLGGKSHIGVWPTCGLWGSEAVWEGAAHFSREEEFSQASGLFSQHQDFSPLLLWEESLALVAL